MRPGELTGNAARLAAVLTGVERAAEEAAALGYRNLAAELRAALGSWARSVTVHLRDRRGQGVN